MHGKIIDNHMDDNFDILKRHSSIRLLTKEGVVLTTSVRLDSSYLRLSNNNAETDTVYKYLEKSWFLYEVKASVMFIGEKWQPWRKNTDIIISTVMKWLTCLTSAIKHYWYKIDLYLLHLSDKKYGENGHPCIMPYQ